jgi:acetyl/propionyl-CoA carboxylase alpha subunit
MRPLSTSKAKVSPMPGKITKIIVQAGQSVKEGDSIIVMEAMKMEYTLKSSINAKVKKINCQVNEQVTLGALLVELEN